MKWLFVLFLAIIIFGGAAWFGYNYVIMEDIHVAKEQRGEGTPEARIDLTLHDCDAAATYMISFSQKTLAERYHT